MQGADTSGVVVVGCHAMATRFEAVLWGGAEADLRAAGEEALAEVQRLDAQLSRFRDDSDLYEVNALAADHPVQVEPRVFALLERAARLSEETEGAFDPTVGPLLEAWGIGGGREGRVPGDDMLAAARDCVGIRHVCLDPDAGTVRFARQGVRLDLGAIGKGWAIERAADILRESGVGGALLHGGTSTSYAVGGCPDGSPWPVAVRHPLAPDAALMTVPLMDRALSVSAPHGRAFTEEGVSYGHVLDPRTGRPTRGALLSAVSCPSATDSDALSTALLVLGEPFVARLATRPDTAALVAWEEGGFLRTAGASMAAGG